MNLSQLHLRPISEEDLPFLFRVFVDTRPDILAATHLSEDQRNELMRSQFKAQHVHYMTHFPSADFGAVQLGDKPVGRLYVNRTELEIHVIDIALLADYQGQGLGTALMKALLEEARLTTRCVRIHVEKTNPAIKFYRDLGFEQIGEKPMHFEMKWQQNSRLGASR